LAVWIDGERFKKACVVEVKKAAASTISRTTVVLPVCRGPTMLITRVVFRVLTTLSVDAWG
jgi:hypothetical protein